MSELLVAVATVAVCLLWAAALAGFSWAFGLGLLTIYRIQRERALRRARPIPPPALVTAQAVTRAHSCLMVQLSALAALREAARSQGLGDADLHLLERAWAERLAHEMGRWDEATLRGLIGRLTGFGG